MMFVNAHVCLYSAPTCGALASMTMVNVLLVKVYMQGPDSCPMYALLSMLRYPLRSSAQLYEVQPGTLKTCNLHSHPLI